MGVSAEEVRRIAALIRVEVSEEEIPPLKRHFDDILEHFRVLQGLDLDDGDPFSVEGASPMPLREDVARAWPGREEALSASRGREGDFFRVPRIGEEA